jgi:transposase
MSGGFQALPEFGGHFQCPHGLTPVHMTLPGYDSSIGGSGMSSQRYSPEFKEEAARQIVDRGYSVAEVSKRLGVSAHSLYKWVKAIKPDKTEEQAAALIEAKSEVLKLRAQLRRTEEERDILKKAARYFAKEPE